MFCTRNFSYTMFALMFSLLLVGAMVSQVFSGRVLVVAFDSLNRASVSKMPSMKSGGPLAQQVARPRHLIIENPTMSFPNLHSLATGVSPKVHRVIANKMFSRDGQRVMFNEREQFNIDPELVPIWTQAVAKNIRTATINWPGSNFTVNGLMPLISEQYNTGGSGWDSRIIKIKKWFTSENIQFGMAYFEDTDRTETEDRYIERVEKAIWDIYNGLKDLEVDIIIMSTHGTKQVPKNHVLNINDYVFDANCKVIALGPVSFLRFNTANALLDNCETLKTVDVDGDECVDHGKIFTVHKTYERTIGPWNMKDFDYLENTLTVTTLDDYTFYDKNKYEALSKARNVNVVRENGYSIDNKPDMRAILFLIGPSFKKNFDDFQYDIPLKKVYQLIRKLLGIKGNASSKQIEDIELGWKTLRLIDHRLAYRWSNVTDEKKEERIRDLEAMHLIKTRRLNSKLNKSESESNKLLIATEKLESEITKIASEHEKFKSKVEEIQSQTTTRRNPR